MTLRNMFALATAGSLALAAGALLLAPAAPAGAQEVVQDEGSAYRTWHEASQAPDNAKAIEAAKAYIAQYPTGQYADFLKKWLVAAQMTALDAAIREKRAADMVKIGREVLAGDPENLNVLYALALNVPGGEGVEFAKSAIGLVEAGKTMANVQDFDKNETLGRLTQILAVDAQKGGNAQEAIKLHEKSMSLAPKDSQLVTRSLYAVYNLRVVGYGEAAKAWNAIPAADKTGPEPKPEVKAALDRLNQEADTLIDSAAAFVAYTKAKNLAAAAREKVNQALETTYKTRHPEDGTLAGLQKLLQDKEAALGAAAPAAAPGD